MPLDKTNFQIRRLIKLAISKKEVLRVQGDSALCLQLSTRIQYPTVNRIIDEYRRRGYPSWRVDRTLRGLERLGFLEILKNGYIALTGSFYNEAFAELFDELEHAGS